MLAIPIMIGKMKIQIFVSKYELFFLIDIFISYLRFLEKGFAITNKNNLSDPVDVL